MGPSRRITGSPGIGCLWAVGQRTLDCTVFVQRRTFALTVYDVPVLSEPYLSGEDGRATPSDRPRVRMSVSGRQPPRPTEEALSDPVPELKRPLGLPEPFNRSMYLPRRTRVRRDVWCAQHTADGANDDEHE